MRGAAGDGGLNPLLKPSVPELNQALLVEPDPGNPPLLRCPHQRHGAGPQGSPLGKPDELVPLGGKVEAGRHCTFRLQFWREERMQEGERQPAGLHAHVLLLVLVDHVVVPARPLRAGLPEGDAFAGHVLQLQRDVLKDVAHPGAFALGQPPDEPARLPVGAAVQLEPRQRGDERVGEPRTQLARRPVLQGTEVYVELDDGEMSVQARPHVHRLVQNAHFLSTPIAILRACSF